MPTQTPKICPILTVGASANANPEMKAKGILIVYAQCTKGCALFIPNKLTDGGTCGLSREPMMMLRGSAN